MDILVGAISKEFSFEVLMHYIYPQYTFYGKHLLQPNLLLIDRQLPEIVAYYVQLCFCPGMLKTVADCNDVDADEGASS